MRHDMTSDCAEKTVADIAAKYLRRRIETAKTITDEATSLLKKGDLMGCAEQLTRLDEVTKFTDLELSLFDELGLNSREE